MRAAGRAALVAALLWPGLLAAAGLAPEMAEAGRKAYARACASCHGARLQGTSGPVLSGPLFLQRWLVPPDGPADLDRVIRERMPAGAPGSLSAAEYDGIMAHILTVNGHVPGTAAAAGAAPAAPRTDLPLAPLQATPASGTRPDDGDLADPGRNDWLTFNRAFDSQRHSALDQINRRTVRRLAPACIFPLNEDGNFQSGLVVFDGRMFFTTARSTYALDAATCRRLWRHEYEPQGHEPQIVNRGVALYRGAVYRGTTDGHLLALDAASGALLWDAWVADSSAGYFLSSAPVAFDGKLFIGEAGADWGANGHVHAFDATTGRRLWTFDVIPTGDQPGAETWGKGSEHGGGSMWTSYSIDLERRLLLVPVGNPAPDFDGAARPGDNLYTNSVIALDIDSGRLAWHVQQIPHDVHDYDTSAAPTLYSRRGRRMMAVANKAGWLYLYDRDSRALVSRQEVTTRLNDDRAPTAEGFRLCPGTVGGVQWNGAALAPAEGLLVVGAVDWCVTLRRTETRYVQGGLYMSGVSQFDPPEDARGWIRAFDAATGAPAWSWRADAPVVGGITPTAGGLTFAGDLKGDVFAFDTRDGTVLWRFATGGGVAGGVVTYAVGGRQYLAVTSGINSARTAFGEIGSPSIVVFALVPR